MFYKNFDHEVGIHFYPIQDDKTFLSKLLETLSCNKSGSNILQI